MSDAFRSFLNRPRRLAERLSTAEVCAAEVWATCTKRTPTLGQTGGAGSGGGSAKDGILAVYADMTNRRDRLQADLIRAETELRKFLKDVEVFEEHHGARDARILYGRYLRRWDWDTVWADLQTRGFRCDAIRTVYNWHDGALRRAEEIWRETHNETLER